MEQNVISNHDHQMDQGSDTAKRLAEIIAQSKKDVGIHDVLKLAAMVSETQKELQFVGLHGDSYSWVGIDSISLR
jgi:hypothetical protein